MFRVTWSEKEVTEHIDLLPEEDQTKAYEANNWLMTSSNFINWSHFYVIGVLNNS